VPRLDSRHHFVAFVSTIVARKAVNQLIAEFGTKKRGREHAESVLDCIAEESMPTPPEEVLLADSYQHYMGRLPTKLLQFAELHLAGFTNAEIAGRLGVVERTVERKMSLIAEKWCEFAIEEESKPQTPGA
jgi:DNA-binding NarL/FixJ family response regulator